VFLHQEDTIYLNSSGQTIANGTRPFSVTSGRELANGLLDFLQQLLGSYGGQFDLQRVANQSGKKGG
jgi:hypothetical protein